MIGACVKTPEILGLDPKNVLYIYIYDVYIAMSAVDENHV